MIKQINKVNLESWLKSIKIEEPRLRYLFYDFNYKAISLIKEAYSKPNSVQFLGDDFYFWTFEETAKFYTPKLGIIETIGYEDLVTARNKDEKFIVLIPKLGSVNFNLLPSDSSKGTSFKVSNSEFEFANYVLNEIFIEEYNFDRISHLNQMQDLLFDNFAVDTYYIFTKETNSADDILKFYGIISNDEKYFDDEKSIFKCIYRVKFIEKLRDFLIANSISELETKLKENNVSKYKEVIDAFWSEPYTLSRDLGKEIDLVFFRNTEKYAALINVEEWIKALNDEDVISPKSIIVYDGIDSSDQYSVLYLKDDFNLNRKVGEVFIPSLNATNMDFIKDGLNLFLNDKVEVEWYLNDGGLKETNDIYNYKPTENGVIAEIKASKFDETRFINLALYNPADRNDFENDFAFSLKTINNKKNEVKIPLIIQKKKEVDSNLEDTILDLEELVKISCPNYNQEDFKYSNSDFTFFKFKNKKNDLELNSRLEIDFRIISESMNVSFIAFQELNTSEIRYNYQETNNFIQSDSDNVNFKDFKVFIEEIAEGLLIFKTESAIGNKWIVIEVVTELGDEKDLFVGNTFLKLKALNDTELSKRKIRIIPKEFNDVHQFYLNEKFEYQQLYLPTIFNVQNTFKLLNPEGDNCPVLGPENLIIPDREFRPSKLEYIEYLKKSNVFHEYIRNQETIKSLLQKAMIGNSIDNIDFSKIDENIIDAVENQLKHYQQLLKENNKLGVYLDLFFIVEENRSILRDDPLAVFFSPFHPFLLHQLIKKARLMHNTVFEHKIHKPNSLCQTIQLNIMKEWVLLSDKTNLPIVFQAIDSDSLLFTGFINIHFNNEENNLSKILNQFEVESNDTGGFLSYTQIQSALKKSFDYLSKKPEFNICLKGELSDQTTNKAILDWIQKINKILNEEFLNHQIVINIYDQRSPSINPYPASNEISYFKNDLNLDFNWYKINNLDSNVYDLTIVTSQNTQKSILVQSNEDLMSNNFNYNNLVSFKLNKNNNNTLLSDLLSQNSVKQDLFDEVWNSLNDIFFQTLKNNKNQKIQIELNLQGAIFENTQLLALSSSISSSRILQKVNQGKSLWEFSISDFSFQDSGRGDYYLLAEEQNDYVLRFKNFIQEINSDVNDIVFNEFINYSKEIGLFQLKNLLSNSNFLKEFIACVTARKLVDCVIRKKNSIIIPYDLFEPRLRKIQKELQPNFDKNGTQFPDFILIEFIENELGQSIIDFRLIEIKYRKDSLSEKDMNQILNDQTSRIKEIFYELNNYRTEYDVFSMWHHTLSVILSDMFSYYSDNNDTLNSDSAIIFNKIINSEYLFRLNDSLLIAIDGSLNFESNKIEKGEYFKVPTRYIHQVFDCNSEINKGFSKLFINMERTNTNLFISKEIEEKINENDELEVKGLNGNLDNSGKNNEDISDFSNIIEDNTLEQMPQLNVEISKTAHKNISPNSSNVILGKDRRNKEAFYYPKGRPGGSPLPNYNIMVTGSSGKGKTQFVKSFIYQQSLTGTSFTIIDFRNDYSDKYFCDLCKCTKIEVKFDGIPYNPLIPRLGVREDGTKYYDVSEHINAICAVLGNTFGLGIQQESDLKKAVRKVFKDQNINPSGILEYDETLSFPSFNEVGVFLEEGDKDLEKLYNRLDPLFDLNLFRDKYKNVEFTEIINTSNIFKVSDIQDNKIKNAIAKMIIVSAHGYYLGIPHSYSLKKLFVFDEAHRVLDSDFVEKFIRECRAFGVGLLLSSQQPDDFPENVLGQLSTKIIHGNEADARLTRKIKSLISFRGDDSQITNLKTFDAILNSQDYNNWMIETLAWPQLMILNIVRLNNEGINYIDLISESKKVGINKEWEEYISTLIQKEYIELKNDKYYIKN